jgi:hypothetical protein
MDLIQQILKERPLFQNSETEISRTFDPAESYLPRKKAEKLASAGLASYSVGASVIHFIKDSVDHTTRSLETGAGISTFAFAIKGANHTAITPNVSEVEAIKKYAATKQISMDRVEFIVEPSDTFLPNSNINNLDVVFIDGKHAFPWPIVDWFYTADKLKKGGIMIIDDALMKVIKILVEFMKVDPRWSLIRTFGSKTYAFKKIEDHIHDVAWHMQPYNKVLRSKALFSRIRNKVKLLVTP